MQRDTSPRSAQDVTVFVETESKVWNPHNKSGKIPWVPWHGQLHWKEHFLAAAVFLASTDRAYLDTELWHMTGGNTPMELLSALLPVTLGMPSLYSTLSTWFVSPESQQCQTSNIQAWPFHHTDCPRVRQEWQWKTSILSRSEHKGAAFTFWNQVFSTSVYCIVYNRYLTATPLKMQPLPEECLCTVRVGTMAFALSDGYVAVANAELSALLSAGVMTPKPELG